MNNVNCMLYFRNMTSIGNLLSNINYCDLMCRHWHIEVEDRTPEIMI